MTSSRQDRDVFQSSRTSSSSKIIATGTVDISQRMRSSPADDMKPENTRVSPAIVRHILDTYLNTGTRPYDI